MLFPVPVPVEIVYEIKVKVVDERISEIAQKIHALDTGMTLDEVINLVEFIESLKASNQFKDVYLRKEETNNPRTIEIDPDNKRIFIHLKQKNIPKVGKGYHKVVTQSILYDPHAPTIVANAVVEDSENTRSEVETLETFRNSEGIIEPLYVSKHTKKSGEVRCQIITRLYNKGSLRSFIEHNPASVPLEAKVKIAKDILRGCVKLNSMGYTNRDNNKGNFFIHEENGIYSAVIGDLGGYTEKTSYAMLRKPLGPGIGSNPPDMQRAFYEGRLTESDLYSCHVYAVGRMLYFLLFEQDVPWIETFKQDYPLLKRLYKNLRNPEVAQEIEHYTQKVISNITPRLQELSGKAASRTIEPKERFEYILLQMLSYEPETRKSNAHWLKEFENSF